MKPLRARRSLHTAIDAGKLRTRPGPGPVPRQRTKGSARRGKQVEAGAS
jgi:hypothetical protein